MNVMKNKALEDMECWSVDNHLKRCDKHSIGKMLGSQGGQKTVSLYGKEHFSKIAKGWPKGKKRKLVTPNK